MTCNRIFKQFFAAVNDEIKKKTAFEAELCSGLSGIESRSQMLKNVLIRKAGISICAQRKDSISNASSGFHSDSLNFHLGKTDSTPHKKGPRLSFLSHPDQQKKSSKLPLN